MRKNYLILLASATIWACPSASSGQVAPALGAASSFALFTAVGAFNNVGPTVIQGDIGTNAGAFSGFPLGVVTGNIHVADTYSTQAATDVQAAFNYMSTIPCVVPLAVYGGPASSPQVLTPGSYCVGAATTLAGSLILDAQNNPNALFFLRVSGALTTAEGSTVTVTNGASLNNVYWQVTGRVDLGRNSVMRGTLITDGAINLIEGATLLGRGLSRAGAITLDTNTATAPSAVPTATYWLGNGTTDWFTSANWSAGVPTSVLDATIPTGTAPFPVLTGGNGVARSLTIGGGGALTQRGGTLDVKGTLANSGTLSATGGTVRLSGTAAQAIGGGGSTQFWGLAIPNAAGAIQAGAVQLHGVLALTGGNLATNGQPLTLLSDAAGTALVDNTGGTVNGTATVQRYIDPALNAALGYRHYSAPVSGSTVGDLTTAGFSPEVSQASVYNGSATPGTTTPFPTVFAYDQRRLASVTNNFSAFDKGYVVPASLATPLAVGQGYTVNIGASQLVDFVGQLTTGNQTLNLTRNAAGTAGEADAGWHLVGNPYPAPLDYGLVAAADRPGLDAAIYVYASASQYGGTYRSYANGVGGNPVLPVGQGFFARVSSGQTTATLTFRNSQRLTAPDNTPFQRPTADARPLVQLALRGATGAADALYAYAEPGATAGFDAQYDALKLPNTTGLNLASTAGTSELLAIDGRPSFTAVTVLPLVLNVPAAGAYTLTAAALNNLPNGLDAVLTDATTGQAVNLRRQPVYSFNVAPAQAGAPLTGRFTLSFAPQSPLAPAAALTPAAVALYPNPAHNAFTVLMPAVAGATELRAELLNGLGQVVRREAAALPPAGARLVVDATGLAAGVYTLRLHAGGTALAKRVVLY